MYESHSEIFSQGTALKRTLDALLGRRGEIKEAIGSYDFKEIVFVACGSSYWAALSAHMTMQRLTGKRCHAVKSGDIVMDPDYFKNAYEKPLLILPSRSGSTQETLIAAGAMKERYDCDIVGLVEYGDSGIKEISSLALEFPWANEKSVCQTRSFSNIYLASIAIAAILADDDGLIGDLRKYLDRFDELSKACEEKILHMIADFPGCASLAALGGGCQYGVSVEGAYINIEMSQFPSNYYGTLEWRHGPIVMADESMLVSITCGANAREYEESMAKDTRAKGSRVLSVSALDDFENSDYRLSLGWQCADETVALFSVMALQGFAYHKAVERGIDPDNPPGLVPWISL